ncbi:DUF7550 family protein [Haloarchaeobius sp. TZWWS8]|uniref:DUF7550 family protein n=1 Tax=Haloarchaeobius sp. TZWWS8 TaxID=3446121 RepID=UPI003EB9D23C
MSDDAEHAVDQNASDHSDHGHDDHGHGDHEHHEGETEGRVTSPMQEFSMSQVSTGFIVALVGIVLTIAVPLLLI